MIYHQWNIDAKNSKEKKHPKSWSKERRFEMDNLNKEYTSLKAFVKETLTTMKNMSKSNRQLKGKSKVESVLTARSHLLNLAILYIFESLRKDPRKFYALYHNMSSSSAKSQSSSSIGYRNQQQYNYVPFMNEQNFPIIDYSNEENCEKILLDESEEVYNKMVEDITNKTISDVVRNSESSLSLPQNELSGFITITNLIIKIDLKINIWLVGWLICRLTVF
jgi:hypothetical protein